MCEGGVAEGKLKGTFPTHRTDQVPCSGLLGGGRSDSERWMT